VHIQYINNAHIQLFALIKLKSFTLHQNTKRKITRELKKACVINNHV
jgi:hypothetical protein